MTILLSLDPSCSSMNIPANAFLMNSCREARFAIEAAQKTSDAVAAATTSPLNRISTAATTQKTSDATLAASATTAAAAPTLVMARTTAAPTIAALEKVTTDDVDSKLKAAYNILITGNVGPGSPPTGTVAHPGGTVAPPSGALAPPGGASAPPGGALAPPGGALAPPGGALAAPGGALAVPGGAVTSPGGRKGVVLVFGSTLNVFACVESLLSRAVAAKTIVVVTEAETEEEDESLRHRRGDFTLLCWSVGLFVR